MPMSPAERTRVREALYATTVRRSLSEQFGKKLGLSRGFRRAGAEARAELVLSLRFNHAFNLLMIASDTIMDSNRSHSENGREHLLDLFLVTVGNVPQNSEFFTKTLEQSSAQIKRRPVAGAISGELLQDLLGRLQESFVRDWCSSQS